MVPLSASVVATVAAIAIAMVVVLATLANFVVTYVTTASRVLELTREYRRSSPLVTGASVRDGVEVVFNVTSLGPEPVTIDAAVTLLVDYRPVGSSWRTVEVLTYGVSWYVDTLTIGSVTYPVTPGAVVEVKPGATARAVATLSRGVAPGSVVVLVVVDRWGARAEYVLTYT